MSNSAIFKMDINGMVNAAGDDDVATGDIKFWPSEVVPAGWLVRDGRALSRATYAALFAVLGTRYGAGDGSTTFNIPDDRAQFIRGADMGKGLDVGRAVGSLQEPSLTNVYNGTGSGNDASYVDVIELTEADSLLHFDSYATAKAVFSAMRSANIGAAGAATFTPKAMRPTNRAYVPLIKY